jgi:MOSC domain-containing protein YiiM
LRILNEGFVETGDRVERIESNPQSLTVFETFNLIYARKKDPKMIERALKDPFLGISTKKSFK